MSNVLTDRSPNTSPSKPRTTKMAVVGQTYTSPSDTILSPTSKKLSEIKGKRFANVKAKSLFAKTVEREGLKMGGGQNENKNKG